eukprot:jgi/Tetstr1/439179/TSEL_027624.t1
MCKRAIDPVSNMDTSGVATNMQATQVVAKMTSPPDHTEEYKGLTWAPAKDLATTFVVRFAFIMGKRPTRNLKIQSHAKARSDYSNHAAHEWAAHGLSDVCHDVKSAMGVGVHIITDPSVLVSLPKGSDGRPVGLFGYGGIRGNAVAVDTTIAPILGVTALRAPERHKIQKYDEGVQNAAGMLRFVPFAVFEFGSLAPHAETFLQAQHRRSRHALAHHRGSQTIAAAAPSPKPRAKSEFKPSEMVDAPHSIRTWDVYRLVESQRVEKQIKDLAEFRDSRRLEGMAAQQCQEAIEALERVVQVLDAECVGEECGFRYD